MTEPLPLVIVAVMATMNRSAVPVRCLQALARQTHPLSRVIVADNASTDDTVTALRGLADLPFDLTVLALSTNMGNAGGVEEAMNLAFASGADAVWILDDDSWPRPDSLKRLLAVGWDDRIVRHNVQIDPSDGELTWPVVIQSANGSRSLVWKPENLPAASVVRTGGAWTGALISKRIFEAVGPVNGQLFLRGEDEEYPIRIEKSGFSFELVTDSIMDHPGPRQLIHWRVFGRSFFIEKGISDAKLYYKVRNMVWIKRDQSSLCHAALMALAYMVGVSLTDGPSRFPLLWRSIRDGWKGRLGKMGD
jgi:rhamnopyranosyl-N-acetylglucosaminyl-diphospho-decaprenol beta-1,3/1,4-galactofuranosyltransferase